MASDVDLVVEAINGLKSNAFKDYIFPIGTLAISAFVGLKTSFYAVRYAEDVKQTSIKLEFSIKRCCLPIKCAIL